MNVAVDQAGRDRRALGVDQDVGPLGIDVLRLADRGDDPVGGHDGIGIEQRPLERAREQRADVPDHELALECVVL